MVGRWIWINDGFFFFVLMFNYIMLDEIENVTSLQDKTGVRYVHGVSAKSDYLVLS